jgi:hypothetical protein
MFIFCLAVKSEKSKAAKKPAEPVKPAIRIEDMTEEEKKKAQEEADLANATSLFGVLLCGFKTVYLFFKSIFLRC